MSSYLSHLLPLLLTPSSFQTSHSQASRPASHFLLPLPFPFVFLHWDLLSYLKLSAGSGDFLQPRPWKRRPSAGSSPSALGINKRRSVVEVLKMLTCCGCSLTAWVLVLVRSSEQDGNSAGTPPACISPEHRAAASGRAVYLWYSCRRHVLGVQTLLQAWALQQLLSVIIDFCSFLCSKVFSLFAKLWFMEGSEHAQSMQDLLEVAPTIFMPAQQTEAPTSF